MRQQRNTHLRIAILGERKAEVQAMKEGGISDVDAVRRLIANDSDSYQYLAESIRMHPDQETLKGMMQDAGFEFVKYHNMTFGVCALHEGVKL